MVKSPEKIYAMPVSMAIKFSKEVGNTMTQSVDWPSHTLPEQSLTIAPPCTPRQTPLPGFKTLACARLVGNAYHRHEGSASERFAPDAVSPDQEASQVETPFQQSPGQRHNHPM